jgi:hypothetical protein
LTEYLQSERIGPADRRHLPEWIEEGAAMNTNDEAEKVTVNTGEIPVLPRVTQPADEADVMCEQFEFLLDHVAEGGLCGCPACQRYVRTRAILLEVFGEPPRAAVAPGAHLRMAA